MFMRTAYPADFDSCGACQAGSCNKAPSRQGICNNTELKVLISCLLELTFLGLPLAFRIKVRRYNC